MSKVISMIDEDCKKFIDWLDTAKSGQPYCYHKGAHISGIRVARMVFQAYEKKKVILYQRREEKNFSYWAQKI